MVVVYDKYSPIIIVLYKVEKLSSVTMETKHGHRSLHYMYTSELTSDYALSI